MTTFKDRLRSAVMSTKSLLCVGLDPHEVPVGRVADFNRAIIEHTADQVCAFKPNLAIYEGWGVDGMRALEATIGAIRELAPRSVIIGDGKRGDIANCGKAYAKRLFLEFDFDAVTVNPYMGTDAVEPFLEYPERGLFILCRTSNSKSGDFQLFEGRAPDGSAQPLYLEVARRARGWGSPEQIGLVMGATFPSELRTVRELYPDTVFLIPGVGAQGGSIEQAVDSARSQDGLGFVLSISRSIIYAEQGSLPEDHDDRGWGPALQRYSDAARRAAATYKDQINKSLELDPALA